MNYELLAARLRVQLERTREQLGKLAADSQTRLGVAVFGGAVCVAN